MKKFKAFQGSTIQEFKDPDTGFLFKSATRPELLREIITYRINNRLEPIEMLNATIDNYLCAQECNVGKCEENTKLHRSIMTTIKGGITLFTNVLLKVTVSQEEADRRAAICVKCPKNIFPDKDGFVKWADDLASRMTGDKKSKYHNELGNCSICTCNLKGKVWYKGTLSLPEDQLAEMKSVGCWQPALNEKKHDG